MKIYLGIISCFFCLGFVYGQKEMKKTELSSDFFLVDVVSTGEKMFVVKYKGACIAYNKKSKEFLLYGDGDGTNIIFLERILNAPLRFYPEKFVSCNYKE